MGVEDEIQEIVRQYGWYGVSITDHDPPFLYSVGLMETCDHPELFVLGLEPDNAHALFAGLFEHLRGSQSFADAGIHVVRIGGDEHRVGVRPVHPTQLPRYFGFAMGYCRHIGRPGELEAVQIFWPDKLGRFPFEAGCDLDVFRLQPRLDLALTPDEIEEFERQFEE